LCVGRLGIRARTPPEPRAFPRLTPRLEVPCFYPAPHVAPRRPRRTRARRAPPYARRPRLRRTTAESTPSPRRHRRTCALFKAAVPSPPHAITTAPPRHHGRRRRTRLPAPLQCRVNPLGVYPSPLGPNRAAPCPGRVPSRRQHHSPRPPPSVPAARPRRRPLRPNFGRHRVLGEHVVESCYLPDRERHRFAAIGRNRAAPTAKGHIARAHFFPGAFLQSKGIVVRC
jgi:hypothetical protein